MTETPKLRSIRVFPEYGCEWSLWESRIGAGNGQYAIHPSTLGLSANLAAALADWTKDWATHFHWEDGWDSSSAKAAWLTKGELVIARLRSETAGLADITYEAWPAASA